MWKKLKLTTGRGSTCIVTVTVATLVIVGQFSQIAAAETQRRHFQAGHLIAWLKTGENGIRKFNQWRERNPKIRINLSRANLRNCDLSEANLYDVDLTETDLSGAKLWRAYFYRANLQGANLTRVAFEGADLRGITYVGATMDRELLEEIERQTRATVIVVR